jgi:hypothetical protein
LKRLIPRVGNGVALEFGYGGVDAQQNLYFGGFRGVEGKAFACADNHTLAFFDRVTENLCFSSN